VPRYTALLDACVLVPIALADTLLRVAERGQDFPAAALSPLGLEAIHPDVFLLDQLDLSPPTLLQVIREQAAHTKRPPHTPQDMATVLGRAGVPEFADEIIRRMGSPLDGI
jgi:hypothetical protein